MNIFAIESESTETVSERQGEYVETGRENFVSRSIECNIEIPCEHRFSVSVLRDLARARGKEKKMFQPFNWVFQLRKVLKGT